MQKQKLKKAEQRKAQQANKASNKAAATKATEQQALKDQAAAIAAAAFAQGSEAESDHPPEVTAPQSIKEQAAAIAAAAFAQGPPQANHQVTMSHFCWCSRPPGQNLISLVYTECRQASVIATVCSCIGYIHACCFVACICCRQETVY